MPVRAVQSGSALNTGWDDGYGTCIDTVHDDEAPARHGHLERIASRIRAGVRISNGQPIGTVGTPGCCDQSQLHFSALLSTGQSCDALDYLNVLDCLQPA